MTMQLDLDSSISPSRQIEIAMLDRMASGALGAGDRLPSVRRLAAEALVNPNTVGKAYRELERGGFVVGRSGSGVYVSETGPALARRARASDAERQLLTAIRGALAAGLTHERVLELAQLDSQNVPAEPVLPVIGDRS